MGLRVTFAMALLVAVAGCKKDEMRPPFAPPPDGSIEAGSIVPPRRDSGTPVDAAVADASMDAAVIDTDAATPAGCITVPAGGGGPNRAMVTSDTRSLSFDVTNAFATWDPADCARPTVVVGLADASCSVVSGHRLMFSFDAAAIEDSRLLIGPVMVGPLDDRLSVAYLRPPIAGMPETWGTCAGSSGSLDLTAIGIDPGDRIAGTFDITLSDCTAPFDTPDAQITGSFDVMLVQALADVCASP